MKMMRILSAVLAAQLLMIPVLAEEDIEVMPEETAVSNETAAPEEQEDLKEKDEAVPPKALPQMQIDNTHRYEYMDETYAEGYEPVTRGDYAVVVLPLCCDAEEKPDAVRISVGLDTMDSPFVVKNYEQTVSHGLYTDADGDAHDIYLAEFWLAMYADRVNGCYPVRLQIADGTCYTVYVNITDGIDPNAKEPEPPVTTAPEEPVILMPKLLIQNVSGQAVNAGETAELRITLKNTSHTEALLNLTLTASVPPEITLEGVSDTLYFEQIAADAEIEAIFRCRTDANLNPGVYPLTLQYDFAYHKGMPGTGTGTARIEVSQPEKMQFPDVVIPAEAVVTDKLSLHLQALNLGVSSVKNVRAELICDGLIPERTVLFGAVDGGTSQEQTLNVTVRSRSGAEPYGKTAGTLRFSYEGADGQTHEASQAFELELKSPFTERPAEPEKTDSKNWYGIMAGIGGGILLLSGVLLYRRKRGAV